MRHIGDRRDGDMVVPVWAPRNVALLFFHQAPHNFLGVQKLKLLYTHMKTMYQKKSLSQGLMTRKSKKHCLLF